jgi:5-formyltetrahydrofolate cyclo-ligase
MTDAKSELRRHSLARRDLISNSEAHEAAIEVRDRALALFADVTAREKLGSPTASVYWPIRSELNTRLLIEALAARGANVALPVMHAVRRPLIFRAFQPGDELVKGPFGLSEPAADKPALDPDVVFAPLAAFDRRGGRLGYGGGIYDATLRELRANKRVIAVGLAYSTQEAAEVPSEAHDQKLDFVVTEREVVIAAR